MSDMSDDIALEKAETAGVTKRYPWLVMLMAQGAWSGCAPVAPGTVGTLFGWLLFVILQMLVWNQWWFWPVFLLLGFVLGCWVCREAAAYLGEADPSSVVWDEMWAFCLVLYIAQPEMSPSSHLLEQLVLFALFRLFDAVKRGPVGWVDRAFKGMGWRGAVGIMLDDLVAAWLTLMAGAVLLVLAGSFSGAILGR